MAVRQSQKPNMILRIEYRSAVQRQDIRLLRSIVAQPCEYKIVPWHDHVAVNDGPNLVFS